VVQRGCDFADSGKTAIIVLSVNKSGAKEIVMKDVQAVTDVLVENVERVIIGKRDVIELVAVGLLAQGHILIEDVPGVGKTMLAPSAASNSRPICCPLT
jgi:predicted ATP-dependent serine protease